MQDKLYEKCGTTWLNYYYEKLNERNGDFSYAICECYNKFIVDGRK